MYNRLKCNALKRNLDTVLNREMHNTLFKKQYVFIFLLYF